MPGWLIMAGNFGYQNLLCLTVSKKIILTIVINKENIIVTSSSVEFEVISSET